MRSSPGGEAVLAPGRGRSRRERQDRGRVLAARSRSVVLCLCGMFCLWVSFVGVTSALTHDAFVVQGDALVYEGTFTGRLEEPEDLWAAGVAALLALASFLGARARPPAPLRRSRARLVVCRGVPGVHDDQEARC